MDTGTLAATLEREHREIDAGIEAFTAGLAAGAPDPAPLRGAMAALRRHIYLEEELLFPPLRDAGMVAPIFVMLREHGQIWRTLDELDARLSERPEADGVLDSCTELLAQLEAHNAKEEPIIYPQADASLTGAAADGLAEFLGTGRMPDGWVATMAR
jgi:iron-sulfur cluster repair protein YtfE (RIC family)